MARAASLTLAPGGRTAPAPGGDAPLIPRVIHWVWLGSAPMPDIFTHYLASWRRHHPSWETRTWRDDTLPPLSCQAEYEQAIGFKRRYDIVRLEILRQFGGVMVDMDVEAIRPIDPLLPGISGFIGKVTPRHVGNQVLGAVPHHPFFEEAVARLRATVIAGGSSSDTAGKAFLQQLLADRPDALTVFPPETFHFQPSFEPPKRPDDFPAVYAVHHELTTYVSPLPPGALERAVDSLISVAVPPGDALAPAQLARLRKYEHRLRRALRVQDHGYAALLRRVEAEREQAEARHRHAQRLAQLQIGELQERLAVTTGQAAHRGTGVVAWARRQWARLVPS
jgi:hypothetical protein